jgi:hypothetical protein
MVTVYTWLPTPPLNVITERLMPDLGHSSLLVHDDTGIKEDIYCSFWPEMESPIRNFIRFWKNDQIRLPNNYEEESDPAAGFMQRPADSIVPVRGLQEERIRRGWEHIKHMPYDLTTWNCSNVSQYLLVAAMEQDRYDRIQHAVECTLADLERSQMDSDEIGSVLRYLATSKLIACRPEDVHRLAVAYDTTFSLTEETPCP